MTSFFAHETAVVDPGAEVGDDSKIWHFAHIYSGAKIGSRCSFGQNTMVAGTVVIGDNVKVQNNVAIFDGTIIEDDVFLGPSCVLTNISNPRSQVLRRGVFEKTLIRRGATVGANATIVCGTTLGRYCFIGAGAVVTNHVPDYSLVVGVPGRQVGWMSRHGHKLLFDETGKAICAESGLVYSLSDVDGIKAVRCDEIAEDDVLPASITTGTKSYREF